MSDTLNTIVIREENFTSQLFEVTITVNDGPEYNVQFPNLTSSEQEELFEWYFEQYLRYPFLDSERVHRAIDQIKQYGESLFCALFNNPLLFSEYRNLLNSGLSNLEFAISGKSADFHLLHWETLKDPLLPQAFAAGKANVFRKNRRPASIEALVQSSPVLNLLIVTARPHWEHDVNYRTINRPIIELIESARLRVNAHILRPGTYQSLVRHLDENEPGFYHLIHFDTHGALLDHQNLQAQINNGRYLMQARWGLQNLTAYEGKQAFLLFEGEEKGQVVPVSASELADLFVAKHIPVCLLNACQSAKEIGGVYQTSLASKLVEAGVQAVLGQSYSITVSAARLLMKTLYKALFSQANLNAAIANGRRELALDKNRLAYFDYTIELEDWLLPVFYQNRPVRFKLRSFTNDEEEVYYQQRETAYKACSTPIHGFVGRDLDILTIEKRLLKHNMLLIRGMGGTGKTTLLEYLASWWERTGWVEKSFYFGYDKRTYTLEHILFEIASQVFNKPDYIAFQASNPAIQRGKIEDRLKNSRYCLILDNCESITGSALAIQNTLSEEERTKLSSFLNRLRQQDNKQVRSTVLFGSRSDELWLASQTFSDNIYNLPGLDEEARTDFAQRILKTAGLSHVNTDQEFSHLMKLLGGFPLAMEVILPNLRQKTVAELIKDLQTGEVDLDRPDNTDKTNSILRCIEYSHSNLSTNAQKLIQCLAPFSVYINVIGLQEGYTDQLKLCTLFADYSFEQWPSVINEITKWGLVEPVSGSSNVVRLQPTFPYFLQQKLKDNHNIKHQLEDAFQNHYINVAQSISQLLNSNKAKDQQWGKKNAEWEFENLNIALKFMSKKHQSVVEVYNCLLLYMDAINDQESKFRLTRTLLNQVQLYPDEVLSGLIGGELAYLLMEVGSSFRDKKNFVDSKKSLEKALAIWQTNKSYTTEQSQQSIAQVYHQLGSLAIRERDWLTATDYYNKSLAIFKNFENLQEQAPAYHQLGEIAMEQRQWQEAINCYEKSLKINVKLEDRYNQGRNNHQLGLIALKITEQSQDDNSRRKYAQVATNYFETALKIYIEFDDLVAQAHAYSNLGNLAIMLGDWSASKPYLQNALANYISTNHRYEQAPIFQNLGLIALKEKDLSQAEAYFLKSISIKEEFNIQHAQGITYHNLGMVAEARQDWPQANIYHQKALKIFTSTNDIHSQARAYHSLGILSHTKGERAEANNYYQKALSYFSASQDGYQSNLLQQNINRLQKGLGPLNF